jgi:hypothetical protein
MQKTCEFLFNDLTTEDTENTEVEIQFRRRQPALRRVLADFSGVVFVTAGVLFNP